MKLVSLIIYIFIGTASALTQAMNPPTEEHSFLKVHNNSDNPVCALIEEKRMSSLSMEKEIATIAAKEKKNLHFPLKWHLDKNKTHLKESFVTFFKIPKSSTRLKLTFSRLTPNNPYEPVTFDSTLVLKTMSSRERPVQSKHTIVPIGQEKNNFCIELTLDGHELEKSSVDVILADEKTQKNGRPFPFKNEVPSERASI